MPDSRCDGPVLEGIFKITLKKELYVTPHRIRFYPLRIVKHVAVADVCQACRPFFQVGSFFYLQRVSQLKAVLEPLAHMPEWAGVLDDAYAKRAWAVPTWVCSFVPCDVDCKLVILT